MVRAALAAVTPTAELGLGAKSPPSWAAPAAESWGPPPLEPWDVGFASGFITLQHACKDQKTWVKSGKKKGKNLQ
jgi:hypothetical protein